ncbi:MAG: hypothetical protein P9F75_11895 [Candidatus Contendobacter sp.]|nr:hypothetical protein [Candidatus Contendobacter sp.]
MGSLGKQIQARQKQGPFVTEGGIEAAAADAHRFKQIHQRSGLVAFLPEE